MNQADFGIDWGTLAAIYLALFIFGVGFNLFVSWLERRGYSKGYVSLLVVAGVAVTVGMTAIISLAFALIVAGAFICSGTPMIIGSVARYIKEREAQLAELRKLMDQDDSA